MRQKGDDVTGPAPNVKGTIPSCSQIDFLLSAETAPRILVLRTCPNTGQQSGDTELRAHPSRHFPDQRLVRETGDALTRHWVGEKRREAVSAGFT